GAKPSEHQRLLEADFEQRARSALGEPRAEAAYQRGYRMSLEEALQVVRQDSVSAEVVVLTP
ncbi:MAG: hypothetical protein HC933_10445, partial [Pleurocapsa sp. SU_196_0]|nr:hypothetical protein [Pleurocapsa sp. SU_196_0]